MTLRQFQFEPSAIDFRPAYEELLSHIAANADANQTWGYFPELSPEPEDYPACLQLERQLEQQLFQNTAGYQKYDYKLAFIRAARGKPTSKYGGLHIDVHRGVAHRRDPNIDSAKEIRRLLLNPYSKPRKVEYAPFAIDQLIKRGVNVSRQQYQVIDLPRGIKTKSIEIPPLQPGLIHGLEFVSSQIAHAGVTNEDGHFLVAYGAYF